MKLVCYFNQSKRRNRGTPTGANSGLTEAMHLFQTSPLKFPLAIGIWLGALYACQIAEAQPAAPPAKPSFAQMQEIEDTVAALVESTQSDEGFAVAQKVVSGASPAPSLPRAWHEWRLASLQSEDDAAAVPNPAAQAPLFVKLQLQNVEVKEFHPVRSMGGALPEISTALVKVRLYVATEIPGQPEADWPADPWQGEFTLQKLDEVGAPWQFAMPVEDAPPGGAIPTLVPAEDALIELPERGGNRLAQAIQVVQNPAAMLRTARALPNIRSLTRLVDAVRRYIASTDHYPPADYTNALLEEEPPETQAALRRAFEIEGTTRLWVLNPVLAGTMAPDTPDPGSEAVPLFWDGTTDGPTFSPGQRALIAYSDGRIALRHEPSPPVTGPN